MKKVDPKAKSILLALLGSILICILLYTFGLTYDNFPSHDHSGYNMKIGPAGGIIFGIILISILKLTGERNLFFLFYLFIVTATSYIVSFFGTFFGGLYLYQIGFLGEGVIPFIGGFIGILYIFLWLLLFGSDKTKILLKIWFLILSWTGIGLFNIIIFTSEDYYSTIFLHFLWQFIVIFALLGIKNDFYKKESTEK